MIPLEAQYDVDNDQIVFLRASADGEDQVVCGRLDASPDDAAEDFKRKMSDVRDPDRDLPAPGDQTVTRRG